MAELLPRLAWVLYTICATPYRLFGSESGLPASSLNTWKNCAYETPGSSRTRVGEAPFCASALSVTTETTRTAPDLRVPPTVIDVPFIVSVSTGSPVCPPPAGAAASAAAVVAACDAPAGAGAATAATAAGTASSPQRRLPEIG